MIMGVEWDNAGRLCQYAYRGAIELGRGAPMGKTEFYKTNKRLWLYRPVFEGHGSKVWT